MGYYDKVTFDPNEKFNVRYLPPLERKGKYASVTSKVKSFDNASYKPGGGHKHYPTFYLNWNVEAKVETLKQFKSKSYPNTETGSSDHGQHPEVQSQLEFSSVADDRLSAVNNTRTASSVANSKSPISKYQKSRLSRSQNTNKGAVNDINKTDLNSTPSYLHKNSSKLSQQQPNTDKNDRQISVSKSCDMAELGTSRPGSQSQMNSTVTEAVNEDTLKNTQEINQPENILHENNNPSYPDPRQKTDSRVGVKLQSDVVDIPTNQNIRTSNDSNTKPMNKDNKSTDFRIIKHSSVKQHRWQKVT